MATPSGAGPRLINEVSAQKNKYINQWKVLNNSEAQFVIGKATERRHSRSYGEAL